MEFLLLYYLLFLLHDIATNRNPQPGDPKPKRQGGANHWNETNQQARRSSHHSEVIGTLPKRILGITVPDGISGLFEVVSEFGNLIRAGRGPFGENDIPVLGKEVGVIVQISLHSSVTGRTTTLAIDTPSIVGQVLLLMIGDGCHDNISEHIVPKILAVRVSVVASSFRVSHCSIELCAPSTVVVVVLDIILTS